MSVTPLASRTSTEPWLTKPQLAERLQVSERWLDYQRAEGLPCIKVGGVVRFKESAVVEWLDHHEFAPSPGATMKADPETADYLKILTFDVCAYCGGGGQDHWTNLTGSCQRCNEQKHALPLLEFLSWRLT